MEQKKDLRKKVGEFLEQIKKANLENFGAIVLTGFDNGKETDIKGVVHGNVEVIARLLHALVKNDKMISEMLEEILIVNKLEQIKDKIKNAKK